MWKENMAFQESQWTVKLTWNEKYWLFVESPSEAKVIWSYINKYFPWTVCLSTNWHFCELKEWDDYWIEWFDKYLTKQTKTIDSLNPKFVVEKWHTWVEKNLRKLIDTVRKNKWTLFLATDPDREWEFISFELFKFFNIKEDEYIRVRSTSIEENDYIENLNKAIKNNQKLDKNLYNAAIVRTLLDKLYWFIQTKKLWSITWKSSEHYNLVLKFLEEKLNKFKEENKSLEENEQFKNIIQKYQTMIDNLKNKKNVSL